jgi:MerR family transcriptional regulator/heat shock protein HspR
VVNCEREHSDMTRRIIPREIVARELSVSTKALVRYESLGLVRAIHDGQSEGYEPTQIRRLWSIVSYQRDMGVNLAGVEVILQLVDHLSQVRRRVDDIAHEFRALLEEDDAKSVSNANE